MKTGWDMTDEELGAAIHAKVWMDELRWWPGLRCWPRTANAFVGRAIRALFPRPEVATREAVEKWFNDWPWDHDDAVRTLLWPALQHFYLPAPTRQDVPKAKPTVEDLEAILQRPDDDFQTFIKPDGSLGSREVAVNGVPSVPEIAQRMHQYRRNNPQTVSVEADSRVAHAMMLELAPRQKMMIDDMMPERWEAWIAANAPVTSMSARILAANIHRLANTHAEPALDPDAGAKQLAATWQAAAKIPLSNPWDKMKEDQRNGWRAVAKQVKP